MRRKLPKALEQTVKIIAFLYAVFHLYTGFSPLLDVQQRVVHAVFAFTLTFLVLAPRESKGKTAEKIVLAGDIALIGLMLFSFVNVYLKYNWWLLHPGMGTPLDLVLGVVAVLVAVEGARRTTGWIFPILVAALFLYAFLGKYIPGTFHHAGLTLNYLLYEIYQMTGGLWGSITGVSATIIAIFIFFANLLLVTGGAETFTGVAVKLGGRLKGGPALVAVIASAFFGSLSGSAIANVVSTGSFTIPMMKKIGYKPEFAGAVEASASTGGQIMPPIMGASAFVICEFLAISYLNVIVAAILPAIFYYVSVFLGVLSEAYRIDLPPVPEEQIPLWKSILVPAKVIPVFGPIIILFVVLAKGYSTLYSGFLTCVSTMVLYLFFSKSFSEIKNKLKTIIQGLQKGGLALIEIAPIIICANIVVSLLAQTGLAVKISGLVTGLMSGSMLLALVLIAIAALIMGMGVPTVAAYLLVVAVLGPAMKDFPVTPLQIHLFVFYYAILSAITPPVCAAVYAAAGIAQANWLKIASIAMRLTLVGYLIPFAFIYDPSYLIHGHSFFEILKAIGMGLGAASGLSICFMNPLKIRFSLIFRLLFGIAGILFLTNWDTGSIIALGLICLNLFGIRFLRVKLAWHRESL